MASVINFLPLQEGSGDPSPENVRPITAPVHIVGKNLFDESSVIFNNWTDSSGVIATINKGVRSTNIPVFPNTTYSVGFYGDRPYSYSIIELDAQGSFIRRTHKGLQNTTIESPGTLTVTTSSLTAFIYIQTYTVTTGQVMTPEILASYKLMLEQNSTSSSTYEPYTETPVYGGYLDIGNGEVVEEWLKIVVDETATVATSGDSYEGTEGTNRIIMLNPRSAISPPADSNHLIDKIKTVKKGTWGSPNDYIWNSCINHYNQLHIVFDNQAVGITTEMTKTERTAKIKAWLADNALEVVYQLETPITHTLNSAQLAHIMAELNVRYSSMLESRRRILMNSPHVEKLTTETAFFKTDLKAPLKECKISFTPVQEGTGDPSPTNIRPINCWTKVNVGQTRKNVAEVVGYSATNGNSIAATRSLSNSYGTTLSTVDFVASHGEVTITQTAWPETSNVGNSHNGYYTVFVNNLIYGKYYTVSFKVTNITNNPLNIERNKIALVVPSGSVFYSPSVIDGDRVVWRHVQWRQAPNAVARSNFEIRNCGMSFTMSDFMVTAEDEEDQTYESYTDTDIIPITFPFATRNHINIVGYSAQSTTGPKEPRKKSNPYGTTLSTIYPENTLTITQDQWTTDYAVTDYRNGYFNIVSDNLKFGKKYIVSFKIDEITNNPLNVSVDQIRIGAPSGIGYVSQVGDRVVFRPITYKQATSYPNRMDFYLYNCGMSMTISDIMVTEEDETDQTYVPFKSNFYGGYVDLVKGEIVAEWMYDDMGNYNWDNASTASSSYCRNQTFPQAYAGNGTGNPFIFVDKIKVVPLATFNNSIGVNGFFATINSTGKFYIMTPEMSGMTPAQVKEYVTGIKFAVKLETPIHYPIDPVTIKTLKGINTIWADANGSMDLSYWTH